MSTSAILFMVSVQGVVCALTGYFFYKVLTTKPNPEPDSYSENDEELERK